MDIAKYIGLFLLKNHFCYVHGLGNMELIKKPSIHDGKSLQAPSYEVVVAPGGSIDDNLANFIATNEQISISKAANALRDYSMEARKEMAEGKDVVIPNVGRFLEDRGKIKFITDENFRFTPAGIPTVRNSKQLEEQNSRPVHKPSYPEPQKPDSVNWSMVIMVVVLVVILAGAGYGIYYYTTGSKTTTQAPPRDTVVVSQLPPADSTHLQNDSMTKALTMPVDSSQLNTYKMVIGSYRTKQRADTRLRALQLSGNHVDLVSTDSTTFLIIASINCRAIDTVHVKDSLTRMFGYRDVTIFK